jgi:hypothetical protein
VGGFSFLLWIKKGSTAVSGGRVGAILNTTGFSRFFRNTTLEEIKGFQPVLIVLSLLESGS